MSDRVVIIGGSTPGRDHLPFPIGDLPDDYNVGEGFDRPWTLTLQQLAKWFWRVKKWHFALSVDYQVPDGGWVNPLDHSQGKTYASGSATIEFNYILQLLSVADPSNPSLASSYNFGITTAPSRESDLVLPRWGLGMQWNLRFDNTFYNNDTAETGIPPTDISTSVTYDDGSGEDLFALSFGHEICGGQNPIFFGSIPFSYSGWRDGFVVAFNLGFGFNQTAGTNSKEGLGLDPDIDWPSIGDAVVSVLGDTFSTPIFTDSVPSDPSYLFFDRHWLAANLAITAQEFWPYTTKDGLPVYDTSTGAQLRDPFS